MVLLLKSMETFSSTSFFCYPSGFCTSFSLRVLFKCFSFSRAAGSFSVALFLCSTKRADPARPFERSRYPLIKIRDRENRKGGSNHGRGLRKKSTLRNWECDKSVSEVLGELFRELPVSVRMRSNWRPAVRLQGLPW